MLAQVLNRDFTLGTVAATERQLRSVVANRKAGILGRPGDPRELATDELEELADALGEALAAESVPDDGPVPAQPGDQPPPPKSDYAYVPGNPVVGLVQAALEAHATGAMGVEERTMDDDRREGGEPSAVADVRLDNIQRRGHPAGGRASGRSAAGRPEVLDHRPWLGQLLRGHGLAAVQKEEAQFRQPASAAAAARRGCARLVLR